MSYLEVGSGVIHDNPRCDAIYISFVSLWHQYALVHLHVYTYGPFLLLSMRIVYKCLFSLHVHLFLTTCVLPHFLAAFCTHHISIESRSLCPSLLITMLREFGIVVTALGVVCYCVLFATGPERRPARWRALIGTRARWTMLAVHSRLASQPRLCVRYTVPPRCACMGATVASRHLRRFCVIGAVTRSRSAALTR